MKPSNPESIPGNARVFVACLLSFAILITPFAAIAAPRAGINPVLKAKAAPAERKEASNAKVTSNLAPAPVPAPAPAAPIIVATMTDNRPSVDPASAKPGDAINYTVTIQNTGDADATGVQFNDDVDVHTAYVNGSGLLAMADSYNTIGDVQISVPAPGVLTNDLDISAGNNTGMTATAQTVSSAQCAACNNVTINANGSFTYDPKAGFTGTDSFTYTAKNAANKTASATVQITVTGRIWFVNNNAGACASSCDGRLSHPFQSLTAFQAVNDGGVLHPQDGDVIFVYENTTGTAYTHTGLTLRTNQKLIGQDATATLISLSGLTQPSGTDPLPTMAPANGNFVTIRTTVAATNGINLGSGNTLRGFTVNNTTGAKISGSSFGTLTVGNNTTPDVTLSGTGQALNLTTGVFAATSGFVSVSSTSSGTQGINLSGISGTASFGSTTISGNTTQCLLVGTTTADINFGNTSCTGGTDGVSFQNNANVGHVLTFGTLNVSGGSNSAFNHGAGGGNVTVTGAATLSSLAQAIQVSAPTATDVINFQAATSATSSGAGATGVNWVGTAGAALTFNALTIQTNAGTGLNATTGGTVTVTNGTGTINNTAQAAAAIIASSVALNTNFSAIKSTGGTNGVSLTTVTGTSTFGSNSTLSGASGATFNVSGGTTSITYSGNITQANNAAMVSIAGGHNTGTISFDTGALSATNGTGLQFNNADGTYNFHTATGSTTLNGGDAGIDITNGSGGSFTFGKNGTPASFVITKANAGNAFDVDGSVTLVTAGITYNGNITQSNTGAMVNVNTHSTGTITFQGGTLSATNGTGLQFSNADGTYNFTGTTTLNGGDAGIDILNGSAGTFAFGGTSITNPSGVALNVDGTAAAITGGITISGAISKTSAGKLIDFFNYDTGTATISGNLSCTTSCQGVEVTNNGSAGTVNFSGGTKTLTTGASTAVNLDTNTGGSVNFTGGGLAISTTSGVGFNAIGGGSVNVTTGGTDNTVSTTTGTAVNIVTPTNIGGSGVTFKSVTVNNGASNSATNAIILNGTTGAFTVSGDGSTGSGMCGGGTNATAGLLDCDGSGGTINKTTGIAVLLTSATNVTLRQMNITSPALDGIKANGGSSLTFSAIFVNTPGASNPGAGGDGFGTGNGIRLENVTGTSLIDNNTRVTNWQALVSNAVLLHNTATNFTSVTFQDSKIDTSATGSAGFNGNLNTATSGTINLIHNEFTLIDQNAVQILNNGSGTITSIVQKNNFHDADNTGGDGNNTFFLALAGSGQNNFTIGGPLAADGNTFKNLARLITLAGVLQVDCAGVNTGGAKLNGTIQNNNISNDAGFVNGRRAIDIQLEADAGASQGAHSVLIANNTINNVDKQGVNMTLVTTGGGDIQNGNYTIKNNNLTNVGTEGNVDSGSGIEIESNADAANVGSNVSGNFLIQSNSVQNNNNSAVGTALEINNRPFGGNNTSVFNLTILGNTLTNSNAGASAEVFEIVNSSGDGTALPNTCLDLNSGNTSVNNAVGGNGTGFKLTNNAGTFAIEGLGASTPSAFLGPKNQSNGVSPATITSVGSFVNSAGCANSTAMFMAPPPANQNLFASADFSKATIDGTAAVHTETNSSIARADLAQATVDATAIAHTEAAANTRTVSASFGALISSAAHSLATLAGKADSLVVPTAYAGNEAAAPKAEVRNQKSDVKLNHAAGRRAAKSATTNSAFEPVPVGCSGLAGRVCVNIGTLKPGDSVQISFSVTVNNPPNLSLLSPPKVTTQGTVSGGNFANVSTNDPDTVAANDTTDTPIDLFDVKFDSINSSLNPSSPTDPVTYTATISINTAVQTPPVGTVPTGTITFRDNAVDIATCTNVAISGSGPWTAQCTIPGGTYTGGTNHPISGRYNGDPNFDQFTSATLVTQVVQACNAAPVVTKIADTNDGTCDADCSLREAIATACNSSTITFDTAGVFATPQTITLTLGALSVGANVTIDGPNGATQRVTVNGGGANRVFSINSGKTVTIRDLNVTNGLASGAFPTNCGGAIYNDHAILTLIGMAVTGSNADTGGGVCSNGQTSGSASLTIINSTFSGNTATSDGGAIYNSGVNGSATLNVTNSTVSGNNANGNGGGIFTDGTGGVAPVAIMNCTIAQNRSDNDTNAVGTGGGLAILGGSAVTLRNSIVDLNWVGASPSTTADDIQGAVIAGGTSTHNIVGSCASCGLTDNVDNNKLNVAAATLKLAALNSNGGPVQTHALLFGSIAVDTGNNAYVVAPPFLNVVPITDNRGTGFPRIADSADADTTATVDIGAFELHPSIEDIPDQSTNEDTVKNVTFNLGDDTGTLITGAGGSVTATSSNTTLVPNAPANLSFTGSNGSRTLQITPALNQSGVTTITVTVTATNGRTASDTFDLTVVGQNDNPNITTNTGTTVNEGSTGNVIGNNKLAATDVDNTAAQLTFTVGTATTNGTLKNNGTPLSSGGTFTQADIDSNLLTYDHNGSETTSDSFTFTVTDGAGGSAGPATFNITVTPQNDPPTIGNNTGITVNEGSAGNTITNAMLSVTDPDNTAAQLVFTVGTAPANGTLKKGGGALAGGGTFTQADINGSLITYDHNGSETTSDSFTFTVSDGAGGSIGLTTFNITITPVNDAPVVTTTVASLSYTENDPATAVDSAVTVTDVDSANLVGATVSITANFQSGEDALSWTDNNLADNITLSGSSTAQTIILTGTDTVANYQAALRAVKYANSSDNPSTATRTVTFTVNDGGGVNNTGSNTRNITVAAQNDNPGVATNTGITVNEGSAGNTITNAMLSVTDPDNTAAQLVFTVGTAPANGTLKKGGGALAGGSTFTQADINGSLITYDHNGSETTSDSFTFTVSDGAGGSIGLTTFNITITPVNDAPVVTTTVASLSYTENDPATAVDSGVTVTDVDSTNLVGATVSITANFQAGEDALSWTDNNLADNITLSGSSTAQTIILTGTDTVANYQAALRAVKYANSSDNPSTATRTVTFTVDDGAGVNNTGSNTRNITVAAQNDNPTLTTNAGLTVVNGGSGTIDNTRLKVDDADNTAAQLVFTIGTSTVNGTLKNGAAVLSAGSTFTQDDINNNQITYQHVNLATISDSFTFTVSDGAGGSIGLTTFNITTGCGNSLIVTSNADNGNGTLRQAIAAACSNATITFDMSQVVSPITLTTGELVIDKNLTINGPTTASLTISGNLSGRVFHVNPGITASISSLTMSNGRAAFGGGLYNEGTLTIYGSTINGNASADGADNGGAANGGNGGDGGGFYSTGTLNIINSTISGNSAGNGGNATGTGIGGNGGNGGGIYNSGTLLLINDSISENRAGRNGLNVNGDSSNVDLGTPGSGGGLFTSTTTAILRNTIIAGNLNAFFSHNNNVGGTSIQDNNNDGGGTVDSSSSFNLIGAIDGLSGITPGNNGNQAGGADAPLNPLFGPLTNNGGPTSTYLPQQFSPAIDAGSNALATDQNNVALTTDQRGAGFPRILNGTVDIGSVETTPPPPPPPSADVGVSKLANVNESLADRDIIYTITVINAGPDSAANVVLNDVLPGNLTFVSMPTPGGGWNCTTPSVGAGGTVNCTNPSLASGSNTVFTLTVHIPPGTPGGTNYHNVATVSTTTSDPNNVNDSYPADTLVGTCLTNPVVTSNGDSGPGTLRQAILDACDGASISFDMNQVVSPITLTTAQLLIDKNLTISGPAANLLTVKRSTGGATPDFRIFAVIPGKTASISGLTINNGKTSGDGGGVFNQGTLILSSSAVTGNQSTASGGGVANDSGATTVITDSTISGNNGVTGGGIANGGTFTLVNSTVSGNTGDGLSNNDTANLTNDTFSDNTVRGISNNGVATVNIRNTIVANTPGAVGDVSGTFTSQGNNFVGKRDGSTGFTNGVNSDKVGTVASPLSALLAVLGNYGGPTQTHALLPGSPALDSANNCVTDVGHCGDANIPQLTSDQRGLSRQVNGTVDIGSFESAGFTISATSGTPQSAPVNTAFGAPLVATVTSASGEPVNGGQVTFTAPGAGASATFTGNVTTIAATISSGQASASATANGTVGGPYNVTANGAGITGTANFSLTNQKANQTITFAPIANKTFGDADFMVSPTASSGLPVSLAASGQCTVTSPSPGTVHITAAGSCTITASQAGDASYNPAPNVPQSFTIAKANQTITFGALANKTFGDPDFGVSASASSGLAVAFGASGNCTVTSPSPGTVHITGAGSCTITASQAGNANYNPATNVPQSFTIAKANQTITFGALANKTYGDPDFAVNATASSGLPVSFAGNANCTVTSPSPGTVHLVAAGTCTITASQAGDANYNPATNVPQSFTIAKAATSTAVSSNFNPSDLGQSVTFRADVTSVAPKTGTVQFKDNGNNLGAPVALDSQGVALFSTSSLTAGTHTITADYSGDANFLPSTGTLSGGQVVRAQPSLSINDVSISEGNSGTKVLTFTITLSAGSNLPVSVDYATANNTATAGSDYVATNGSFTFNPLDGDVIRTVNVTINGDVNFEPNETFFVNLTNPVNATISKSQGVGTIQNDDAQGGIISFSQAATSVNESTGIVTLTVVRTNDVSQAANVDYATDDTGSSTNCAALNTGLASQRCDYTSMFGTLKFAANETQKTIDVPINLDAYTEGPETFSVKLSNPTGGALLAVPSTEVVTINDSASPAPNAIDDTTTFVRQQYRDFLNREADAAGLAFWKDNIDKCNDPARRPAGQTVAQCIELQRITTSAAFFLSIEFKQTGGMVREFYVAALDRPATNNMPNFVEFMRDTQAIQKGVVVGQGNWQQTLDANRTAFMNDFVMRAEFVALYPTADTPTQYVDKLYLHANVAPVTAQERLDAIQEFGGAGTAADPGARGRALLRITQNGNFQAREANRTFVQIEYFGYLRRNPNDPPDGNFTGYNFWVMKLDQAQGDYLKAEMVKAFLSSLEYRARFGP